MNHLKEKTEAAWVNRALLENPEIIEGIEQVLELLDKGKLRIAEKTDSGWVVNEWLKKAVLLYFPIRKMETFEAGPMEFYDKIRLSFNSNNNYISDFEELYQKLGTMNNYFGFTSFKKREWLWILNDIIQIYPKIDFI